MGSCARSHVREQERLRFRRSPADRRERPPAGLALGFAPFPGGRVAEEETEYLEPVWRVDLSGRALAWVISLWSGRHLVEACGLAEVVNLHRLDLRSREWG